MEGGEIINAARRDSVERLQLAQTLLQARLVSEYQEKVETICKNK